MRVAVIGGTGKEGFPLAVRWAQAGIEITIGSRAAEKAEEAAGRAAGLAPGSRIAGAANRAAAVGADVIVLTIPYAGQEQILADIRSAAEGQVVIDTTVPLRQYAPPELEVVEAGSAAQQVQALLPGARVVAALHSVSSVKLARFGEPLDGDVLYCGDDADAKRTAAGLIEALGLRPFDAGPLRAAGTLEGLAAAIIGMNQRYKRKAIGLRLTGI